MTARRYEHWDRKLMLCGSQDRPPVMLRSLLSDGLGAGEKRRLVHEHWTKCESWGDCMTPVGGRLATRRRPQRSPLRRRAPMRRLDALDAQRDREDAAEDGR